MYVNLHCFICRPSDITVSEDAGTESGTALTARRSNHSFIRSHPHCNNDLPPTTGVFEFFGGKRRQKFFFSLSINNVTKLPRATLFATILVSFRPHFSSARWHLTQSLSSGSKLLCPKHDPWILRYLLILLPRAHSHKGFTLRKGLRRCWAAAKSTCRICPNYEHFPTMFCFSSRLQTPCTVCRNHRVHFWRTFHYDWKISRPGEVGGACPHPFTLITITYKVAVYAPTEKADTLTLFHYYHRMYSVVETEL